jgi:hypothetical protein
MLSQVSIEIGLLPEAPLTDGALVRLLLVVNVANVTLQI